MNRIVAYFAKEVPWLQPVLAWVLSLLILLAILSIPAYLIFWPFFDRARKRWNAFMARLVESLDRDRQSRIERLESAADQFLKDGGLWRLSTRGEGHWAALISALVSILRKLRKRVGLATESLGEVSKRLSELSEKVRSSQAGTLRVLPALPEPEKMAESAQKLRVAWMTAVLTGVILLGLMLVNTGMLSQILRDLGVVPARMTFIGVPLSYVFAFILTMVEAGLGVVHGATEREDPHMLSIWSGMMIVFALTLACVEGFFYSRVAPASGTFSLPIFSYDMLQSHLFFFWGFVLVMTLFSLGSVGFEACATVLRGSASGTLRRETEKLQKSHERYTRVIERSQEALEEAKLRASSTHKILQGPVANGESLREELDRVRQEIERLKREAPEWAKEKEIALTRSEVHHLAQTGGIWATFALLGIVAVTMTGLSGFAALYPDMERVMLWVLAVGQAVVFFGVGFLLGAGETVVQGEGATKERRVWTTPWLSNWGANVIGGLLVAIYIALFFTSARSKGLGAVWFSNLLVGLFLIAAGSQLSPLLNVLRLWLWRLRNALLYVLEAIWVALMRLLYLLLIVLENLSYLLASPIDKLFGKRNKRSELSGLVET